MKGLKKVIGIVLSLILVSSTIPFAASAAAQLYTGEDDGYGTQVAYVSKSESATVNGNTFTAYPTITDALTALGAAGGTIYISGSVDDFIDVEGRGPVKILGLGNDAEIVTFDANRSILGDTYFDNLTFKLTRKYGEFVLRYAGHKLTIGEKIKVIPTANSNKPYLNVYAGTSADAVLSEAILNGGRYSCISGAFEWGTNADLTLGGDVRMTINGGEYASVFCGSENAMKPLNSCVEGNINFTINGGSFNGNILTGSSSSGILKGNVVLEVNGGDFAYGKSLIAGSTSEKVENVHENRGNHAIIVNGGNLSGVILGTTGHANVDGNEIYIINSLESGAIINPESTADYRITVSGGKAYPVFEGTNLLGFKLTPNINGADKFIYVNGEVAAADANGIYTLPKGEVSVSIGLKADYTINADASFIAGYTDGTFLPQNNMTKAEAITLLSRLVKIELPQDLEIASSFSDVSQGDWYANNVILFELLGFLKSYSGTLNPNEAITRAEFVELVYLLAKLDTISLASFSDVSPDNQRYLAISAASSNGLVNGYTDGTFLPDGNITRAEVVTIVNRLLNRVATGNKGLNSFSDISGHWAENQIIASANEKVQTIDRAEVAIWNVAENAPAFKIPDGVNSIEGYLDALNAEAKNMSSKGYLQGYESVVSKVKSDIQQRKSDTTKYKGTIYYISPNGDDYKDGKSPETAWKTLTKLNFALTESGSTILFERGGEWRGQLTAREGNVYSAYGEGPLPIINSSKKNYADPSLWKLTSTANVYELTDSVVNVGIMAFDHTGELGKYDELVGNLKVSGVGTFKDETNLAKDLEFYSNLTTNKLYLYSDKGNPGERFKSIEAGEKIETIEIGGAGDITISNLCLKYTGAHAIGTGYKKDITITDNIICWCGGSILGGTTRYGNAVESYGSCDGFNVSHNWIYQIYDTGITHQCSDGTKSNCIMKNVNYVGNIIEYCHWSIEYYNREVEGYTRTVDDVYMAYNILRFGAYGWGSKGREGGGALLNSFTLPKQTKNFVFEKNILDRSACPLIRLNEGGDRELVSKDNVYIQTPGKRLGYLFNIYYTFDKNAVKTIEEQYGEKNARCYYETY